MRGLGKSVRRACVRHLRRGLLIAAAGAALVIAAGCGDSGGGSEDSDAAKSGAPTTGSGKAPETLAIRQQQDWDTFDFMVDAGRPASFALASLAYDRLITLGPDGKKFVPYLAKSWKQTPTSVTFKVRTDAKCPDGHALTAQDMAKSFQRWIDVPKRSGAVSSGSIGGWGPGPYEITAKGDTLKLEVGAPYRNLLGPFGNLGIICPAGLKALKADPHALEDKMYGSGPYELVSAQHGKEIRYKLRPEWDWGPAGTSTDYMAKNVVQKVIEDETTVANLLLGGGLDIGYATGKSVERLTQEGSLARVRVPNWYTDDVVYNMREDRPFVLGDEHGAALRAAISTAVAPKQWSVAADDGQSEVVTSPFRPQAECYDPSTRELMPDPSVEAAKQVLTDAGFTYSDGKLMQDGRQVQLELLTSPLMNAGPDYLVSVFQELGIDVKLDNLAGSAYGENVLGGNFDVTVIRGSQHNPAPGANLDPISGTPTPKGFNAAATGLGHEELDKALAAALATTGEKSCQAFAKVQQIMLREHYLLPMVARNYDIFARGLSIPKLDPDFTYPIFYVKPA